MLARIIVPTSMGELRRTAEIRPSVMPATVANAIAKIVSSMVSGNRCDEHVVTS